MTKRRLRSAHFILALVTIALTSQSAPGLAQSGTSGKTERWEFYRAFFDTPHFLQVRMEYSRGGQDGLLEAVIRCDGTKEYLPSTHKPPTRSEIGWTKVAHRKIISHILADGSAIFLNVPPAICMLWPEKWMPAGFEKSLQFNHTYPPDFVPLLSWADRADDPNRVEVYVSRTGLASPVAAIAFRSISFSMLDPADKVKSGVQIVRELRDARSHPVAGYNPLRSHTSWKDWSRTLPGVPEGLWSRYQSLMSLIERFGSQSAPVEIPGATIPYGDLVEIRGLFRYWSGYGLESGLPGLDGKSGVIACRSFARPRTSFLPDRCITPHDWEIPLDCTAPAPCKALLDRRGTRLFFRAGDQPLALPPVDIDGLTVNRTSSGSGIVYLPALRMLVLPY